MILDTVCYIAIVGIQEVQPANPGMDVAYRVHLHGGHSGLVSKEEFEHLRGYLKIKNRIEVERTHHMDPNRDLESENNAVVDELKTRFGDDGC